MSHPTDSTQLCDNPGLHRMVGAARLRYGGGDGGDRTPVAMAAVVADIEPLPQQRCALCGARSCQMASHLGGRGPCIRRQPTDARR